MSWAPLFESVPEWAELADDIDERLSPAGHGDFTKWQSAIDDLPELAVSSTSFGATVSIDGPASATQRRRLESALRRLHPWRKGPFRLFGVDVDTEWRSDWKWARAAQHLDSLEGRRVLDVGGGNGYFGWRMLEAGASLVVGVDPTLVFAMQHRAVNRYLDSRANWVVPLTFEAVPVATFDTVFSMGVIYHRRDAQAHADRLFAFTAPGGQVLLESLVVESAAPLRPPGRYARMRNVWIVPTCERLVAWLEQAGYVDLALVDVTKTSVEEQRTTPWMTFESLADALDPADSKRTVEGHPAPVRAIVVGRKPQ